MGAADVVPGVSGGTMAFILGIYTRLIDAINSFDGRWLRALLRADLTTIIGRPHFAFIIPLGVGILAAFVFFTRVIPLPKLLYSHPEQVYGLFFGLVLGSIVTLLIEFHAPKIGEGAAMLAGLLIGAIIVCLVPTQTPDAWWFIMLCGTLAICAMIVPGISGSFVLLLLGKYAYVIDAISHLRFVVIIPFAVGAVIGLSSFTRLLSFLLHRYERHSLMGIVGILCASLWVIWPFQHRSYAIVHGESRLIATTPAMPELNSALIESIALFAIGFVLVIGLQRAASRMTVQS